MAVRAAFRVEVVGARPLPGGAQDVGERARVSGSWAVALVVPLHDAVQGPTGEPPPALAAGGGSVLPVDDDVSAAAVLAVNAGCALLFGAGAACAPLAAGRGAA